MPRIYPVQPDQTDAKTAATLKAVKAKLGMLPNLFTTLAQAPVALTGYLQLSESLGQGRLTPRRHCRRLSRCPTVPGRVTRIRGRSV